jgi:hypothetical protein
MMVVILYVQNFMNKFCLKLVFHSHFVKLLCLYKLVRVKIVF